MGMKSELYPDIGWRTLQRLSFIIDHYDYQQ